MHVEVSFEYSGFAIKLDNSGGNFIFFDKVTMEVVAEIISELNGIAANLCRLTLVFRLEANLVVPQKTSLHTVASLQISSDFSQANRRNFALFTNVFAGLETSAKRRICFGFLYTLLFGQVAVPKKPSAVARMTEHTPKIAIPYFTPSFARTGFDLTHTALRVCLDLLARR